MCLVQICQITKCITLTLTHNMMCHGQRITLPIAFEPNVIDPKHLSNVMNRDVGS